MPTYRYQLVADIEVDAPNIMAAEKAVHAMRYSSLDKEIPMVMALGSYVGGVRLPSQRQGEPRCRVQVRVNYGEVVRNSAKQNPS